MSHNDVVEFETILRHIKDNWKDKEFRKHIYADGSFLPQWRRMSQLLDLLCYRIEEGNKPRYGKE
jgi:hypothetical protein